jgi:hypothetical protein
VRLSNHESIAAIRRKAELARCLSTETGDPQAREALLKIASQLETDADKLELAVRRLREGGE